MELKTVIGVAFILVPLLVSSRALADESDKPHNFRLQLGADLGTLDSTGMWINGKRVADEGRDIEAAGHLTVGQRLVGPLSIFGRLRYGTWSTEWSDNARESRSRADLSIGPELFLPLNQRWPRVYLHFGASIGPSVGTISPRKPKGVREDYDRSYGVNYGGLAGASLSWTHHGFILDGGLTLHDTWSTHYAYHAGTTVKDDYHWFEHSLTLSASYVYWFR